MKKMIKRKTVILCMLLLGISVSGCGKTRETDETSSKVIQISVAPEEISPTPAPDQVDSAAVTTNGNLTINTYLAEQDAAGISSAESSDSQSDAGSTDNSVGSSDNNEQDSSTSDTEE